MRYFLLIPVFLCCSLASIGQKSDSLLFNAYKKNAPAQLELFFNNWLAETPPVSDSAFKSLNDTIQNVYLVYKGFYNPTNIDMAGGSEWGKDIYSGVKYLLMQDKISYGFVDTLDKEILLQKVLAGLTGVDTSRLHMLLDRYNGDTGRLERDFLDWPIAKAYTQLNDFRPKLEITKPEAVVLTSDYERLLNAFLGNENYKLGTGNIMAPARSKGESLKRQTFLENYIRIWHGHWGGYWQLNSYPYVERITFDAKFENAVIDYRMVYEGGYAYLKKVDGVWKVMQAKRTWIE